MQLHLALISSFARIENMSTKSDSFVNKYPDIRKTKTKNYTCEKKIKESKLQKEKKNCFTSSKNFSYPDIRINAKISNSRKGRVEIFIGKQLKEAISKLPDFNLSAFVREKLKEYLESKGIEIKESEPDLLLLVKCPHCNGKFVTSCIKTVQCEWCGRFFKVYRKRGISRIVKIVKGNRMLLWRKVNG